MKWNIKYFKELDTISLYSILKLRAEVFVVEQDCTYLDIDEKDKKAIHFFSFDNNNNCIAYARILKPEEYYKDYTSISRIVIRKKERGKKLGYELVEKSTEICLKNFPKKSIKISAQKYLQKFYENCGFEFRGENYLEDGIPHCAMYYYKIL